MPTSERHEVTDLFQWFRGLFGPHQKIFSGTDANSLAAGLANLQRDRWRAVFMSLDSSLTKRNHVLRNSLEALKTLIQKAPDPHVGNDGEDYVVSSKLPLILSDVPPEKMSEASRHPLLAASLIVEACQDFLLETADQEIVAWVRSVAAAEVQALGQGGAGVTGQLTSYADELSAKTDDALQAIQTAITDRLKTLEQFKNALQEEFSAQVGRTAAQREELDRVYTKTLGDLTGKTESLHEEVRGYIKFEISSELWQQKAWRHALAYRLFSLLFAVLLLVIVVIAYLGYIAEFAIQLRDIPQEQQFLAIALLLIPVLATAWFLRFVARLAMQNLALANDARQRHALLGTYLRLLADPKKPITEQERVLALAALFRPMVGQGSDDVNPPTVADLLRENIDRFQDSPKR